MKFPLLLLTTLPALAADTLTLSWDNPNGPGVVKSWLIYSSTNFVSGSQTNAASYANWQPWATVPAAQLSLTTNHPGVVMFFAIKATNDWTASPFSVVGSTLQALKPPSAFSASLTP